MRRQIHSGEVIIRNEKLFYGGRKTLVADTCFTASICQWSLFVS